MRRILATAVIAGGFVLSMVAPSFAVAAKSTLYHDGEIVRTVVPPSRLPHGGSDPFYSVTNGVEGQLGIAGVAPGDGPYHGGAWAMNLVTFNDGVAPYLLTSDEDVFAAEAAGDVTVVRTPDADFRCPIQP
jgi:hypothetical protein